MPKLTKSFVDKLKPDTDGKKDVFQWDDNLKGFGIRMKPTGSASWLVQYKTKEGKTRRLAFGKVGVLTPDEARSMARDKLAEVAKGEDPSAKRHEARKANTVSELCQLYLNAARSGLVVTRFGKPKKASTIAIDEGRVARHIVPLIGNEIANKLTKATVQRMVDDIAVGKTAGIVKTKARGRAVVTGGAGTAARVVELLGGIWSWAEDRELVTADNPVRRVRKVRGEAKDRVLNPHELTKLGATLEAEAVVRPAAVSAIRLLALTGLRREEAVGLKWGEIDTAGKCLRLSSTKTGKSTRPIGKAALDILAKLPRHASGWVFPNRDGTGSADLKKQIADLFDKAGITDARAHDLRRGFASLAADEGYGDATIAELLGHAKRGVTATHYIRRPDDALIAAADRVSERIAKLLDSRESAAIVPFGMVEGVPK